MAWVVINVSGCGVRILPPDTRFRKRDLSTVSSRVGGHMLGVWSKSK